jgi:preprotein translocase subunit SecF
MDTEKISKFYDRNYKFLLIITLVALIASLGYLVYFYQTNHDFIHRDLSLTGGTSITVFSNLSSTELQIALSSQIPDLETRFLTDSTGKQNQIIILTSAKPEQVTPVLEKYFGFKLDSSNSSVEFTGSTLSSDFYKQLGITVLIAFFWMAGIVFIIFAPRWKIKLLAIFLNLLFGIFLGKIFFKLSSTVSFSILFVFMALLVFIYIKYSIPSFAVMSCAFADIIMTLVVVDIIGMKLSAAGIVAFLMLIGYSVDTDILLTTRVLKRVGTSINNEIFGAFKTGMTMTLTAIAAIAVALFVVHSFGTGLNQIFEILLIGLFFDIGNTWITNVVLIKWFVEAKSEKEVASSFSTG